MSFQADGLYPEERVYLKELLRKLDIESKVQSMPLDPLSDKYHSRQSVILIEQVVSLFRSIILRNLEWEIREPLNIAEQIRDDLKLVAQSSAFHNQYDTNFFTVHKRTSEVFIKGPQLIQINLVMVTAACLLIDSGHIYPINWDGDYFINLPNLYYGQIKYPNFIQNVYKLMMLVYKKIDNLKLEEMSLPKLCMYFWLCEHYAFNMNEWSKLCQISIIKICSILRLIGKEPQALEERIVSWLLDTHKDSEDYSDLLYFIQGRRVFKFIYCHLVDSKGKNKLRSGIHERKIRLLSLCKLLIFRHREPDAKFSKLSKMIKLLVDLEKAYELRQVKEDSRQEGRKHSIASPDLLPTCLELAFPTPIDDVANPEYICEFAYFRDTIDFLRRKCPDTVRESISRLDSNSRERLLYYLEEYDKFSVCCSSFNVDRVRFRCIDHRVGIVAPAVCPLLNRRMTRVCCPTCVRDFN